MEHRWGERVSVRARVALHAGGLQGIGYTRDVSVSGALLVTGLRAPAMSFVRVVLPLSSLSIEGQIVRHTDNGFAVEWCELAPEIVRAFAQTEGSVTTRVEQSESARGLIAIRR